MPKISRYGGLWPSEQYDDLQIEFWCIKKGAEWCKQQGRSLSYHYEQCRKLLWPDLDDHRWHSLCRDSIAENKIAVLMGCASSGKTHEASWMYLVDYFVYPNETCVLVCSTDLRGLKKRVWGEITMLWEKAVGRYDYLPGHLLDSAVAITTDNIDDFEIGQRKSRNMRLGIFGIPCVQGGKFVGLSKFIGIKQKRMRLIADEAPAMDQSFLSAFSNLNNNEDFRAIILGNPNDIQDPLGKAAEPLNGWTDAFLEPTKTTTWKTRFMNGICVNLIGTDSPNYDFDQGKPARYKYLISREKIADTLSFFPKDSVEYYSMCIGSMKIGTMARRILTRQAAEQNGALKDPIWKDEQRTKVYFVDASYGGDLCVGTSGEFGLDVDGKMIMAFGEPKVIPIIVGGPQPEYQIADFVKQECELLGIPPTHMGHDATGRGSLGTALSKVWGNSDTHPIESGGVPSERPVSLDLFITDEATGQRRLKLCSEHFDRKVSEFYFVVKYAVEAGQIRNMPDQALEDFCARKWDIMKGDRYYVEVKDGTKSKPGMKQRIGRSPDYGDSAAGVVEMARRKGFVISKMGVSEARKSNNDWYSKEAKRLETLRTSRQLQSA